MLLVLKQNLNIFQQHCKNWKLSINLKKTKIMISEKQCRKSTLEKYSFFIDDNHIEISQDYSYLGLSFCANDNFSNSKRILIKNCRRCIFATKSFLDFQKLSIDTCDKLFNTLFNPILLYTSEVWGAYDKLNLNKWEQDPVERLQLYFLGLSKRVSDIVARKEVGQTSLKPTIYLNVLKF